MNYLLSNRFYFLALIKPSALSTFGQRIKLQVDTILKQTPK